MKLKLFIISIIFSLSLKAADIQGPVYDSVALYKQDKKTLEAEYDVLTKELIELSKIENLPAFRQKYLKRIKIRRAKILILLEEFKISKKKDALLKMLENKHLY